MLDYYFTTVIDKQDKNVPDEVQIKENQTEGVGDGLMCETQMNSDMFISYEIVLYFCQGVNSTFCISCTCVIYAYI